VRLDVALHIALVVAELLLLVAHVFFEAALTLVVAMATSHTWSVSMVGHLRKVLRLLVWLLRMAEGRL